MFWTFIDGYMINQEIKNLSRGNDTILRLEPDTIGPQSAIQINISIHEHEEVNWRIEVQNCSPGDYLYVDVLMYDENGTLIKPKNICGVPDEYRFDYINYAKSFSFLTYDFNLTKLTDRQKSWLSRRFSGVVCLGDLSVINNTCSYYKSNDPLANRINAEYVSNCPFNEHKVACHQDKIGYVRAIEVPENTVRVTIRAIETDNNGNYLTSEKTLKMPPKTSPYCIGPGIALFGLLVFVRHAQQKYKHEHAN
jgi:hypothetical protein